MLIIGFIIMMWFVSIILWVTAISLLRGNTSSIHGKVYEITEDKISYGKALGKVVLFMAIGMLCVGGVALLGTAIEGIRNAIIVLIIVVVISTYFFVKIQKKFGVDDK